MFMTWRHIFGPAFGTRNTPLQNANSDLSHHTIAPVATRRNVSCNIQRLCSADFARDEPHSNELTLKSWSTADHRPSRRIDTHIGDAPISSHARQQRCGPPTTGKRSGGSVAHTHESTALRPRIAFTAASC